MPNTITIVFIVFVILKLTGLASCHRTFTKMQLKNMHQELLDRNFEATIHEIVENVVRKAQVQNKETSYKHLFVVSNDNSEILNKKTDQEIVAHLQAILVDADIAVAERKCNNRDAGLFGNKLTTKCKEIVIQW